MIYSSIFSLILFAVFMTASPGPGNLLMMACGVSSNYKKSIFFLGGLVTGKTLVNVLIFFGLGAFVIDNDIFFDLLRYISSVFILFFAISSLRTKKLNNLNSKFSTMCLNNSALIES